MRLVVQRSLNSRVLVDKKVVGEISHGLVVLVGFTEGDNEEIIDKAIKKLVNLRIFDDEDGVMNKCIKDIKGDILSISQFTLYASCKKGNRPSYIEALGGDKAVLLYDYFNKELEKEVKVETGVFGAEMEVQITNDGPVTIMLEFN